MSNISKIFTIASSFALVLSGFSGVQAHAQDSQATYIVTAGRLNIRDKNCKKVGSLVNGSQVAQTGTATINCNINGSTQNLIRASEYGSDAETYMSSKYLSKVISGPASLFSKTTFKVNAKAGVFLRTPLCKRVSVLPNNSSLAVLPQAGPSICKVGNSYYEMMPILKDGQNYLVASVFLI